MTFQREIPNGRFTHYPYAEISDQSNNAPDSSRGILTSPLETR